jgi:hypothetical protein
MADERDPKVSAHYRELGAEEPPRALDEAILAASRRAVDSRPAPLVAPTGRGRWYFPVAAAAIITLAVAVTVQIERQRPDDEFLAQAPAPVPEQKEAQPLKEERVLNANRGADQRGAVAGSAGPKAAPKPMSPPRAFTPDPPAPATTPAPAPQSNDALRDLAKSTEAPAAAAEPARPLESSPRVRAQVQPRSDAAETRRLEAELQVKPDASGSRGSVSAAPKLPAPVASPVPTVARTAPAPQAKPMPNVGAAAIASALYVNPERWLEQIVELRREGKHDDADKLLAEFRRSYPDYKLSDEMRSKVEKK